MKVLLTGRWGYIGKHVEAELRKRGHEITHENNCDAVIHLAWKGLPNYVSSIHYENVWHQVQRLRLLANSGIANITVAGTCLEGVENPPQYAKAKLAIYEEVKELDGLKWCRLFNVWGGEGEREERLVPQLRRAMARGDEKFHVIDGQRHFTRVTTVAFWLVRIAEQSQVTGVIDCCDKLRSVEDFCTEFKRTSPIQIVKDYPMPPYEPQIFQGNPEKLLSIPMPVP